MTLLAIAIAGFVLFSLMGDDEPATVNPELTDEALAEMTIVRDVDGVPVRFFKDEMVTAMLDTLASARLSPGGAAGTMPQLAIFHIWSEAPEPGEPSAQQMVLGQRDEGNVVVATHMAAFPTSSGRAIGVSADLNAVSYAHPATEWAVVFPRPASRRLG